MKYTNRKGMFCVILFGFLLFIACSRDVGTQPTRENHVQQIEEDKEVKQSGDEKLETVKDESIFRIYVSADRTGTKESGISIEQGIRIALDEVNNQVAGRTIELKILDHRGSTPRFQEHLEMYLADENAIAIFSGLHSPPLIASRDFINENNILVLDPWAAAAMITRYPSEANWIFRLSVDDSKAGHVITQYAIDNEKFTKPFLLLEETGWGESNEKNMKLALADHNILDVETAWFNWNIGKNEAKMLLRQAKSSGADAIFFVGNAPEGKVFATAMSELEEHEKLPIRSHWGITGGDFPSVINKEIRDKIDLKFIQTSFSFLNIEAESFEEEVLKRAMKLFPDAIHAASDIKAPTGFIHSYDLTKLLIAAMTRSELGDDILDNRNQIRLSLENLNDPIKGLVKVYDRPFTVYSDMNPDAHEALGKEDLRMAVYGDDYEIILLD